MKTFIKLAAVIAALCPTSEYVQAQTKIISVKNDELTMEQAVSMEDQFIAVDAVREFLFEKGVLKDGYSYTDGAVTGAFYTPLLYKGAENQAKAKIYIKAYRGQTDMQVLITCNEIKVYFPMTDLYHTYNPATNYLWKSMLYDQKKTMLSQAAVEQTNQNLIKYLMDTADQVKKHIKNYRAGMIARR